MVQLTTGYNAIRWTGAAVGINSVAFAALILIVYTPNPVTGQGYFTFEPLDKSPNMQVFAKGYDYLVKVSAPCVVADAVAGDAAVFADVDGYVPASPDTAPTMPVGRTETGVAADSIIIGRLVAQTPRGLLHYSSTVWSHERLLFGISLNNALAGGSVSVRRPGYVHIDGWGLPTNAILLAGAEGRLVTEVPANSFCQIVGRALGPDTLLYQPETITDNLNPQKTT